MREIKVKGIVFNFSFDENLNMWRIVETPNLIEGISIDIEINFDNFADPLDWLKVEKFIETLINSKSLYAERIKDSQQALIALFKSINKNYDQNFIDQIEFVLSGIDFKGNCKIINLEDRFIFDFFFFPQYKIDPYRDIGSFVWRANFRDTLLLGVYCDRI